jgi:hypothetical protein
VTACWLLALSMFADKADASDACDTGVNKQEAKRDGTFDAGGSRGEWTRRISSSDPLLGVISLRVSRSQRFMELAMYGDVWRLRRRAPRILPEP